MKVLVTGMEGYLGSLLAPVLVESGREVRGIDAAFYSSALLYSEQSAALSTSHKDVRQKLEDLHGVDAVVHLAELSNDPTGELAPEVTDAINHRGSVRLANLARKAGVERFVYMSSCSVYGLTNLLDARSLAPAGATIAKFQCLT